MLLRGTFTFNPRPEDDRHTLGFTYNDVLIFLEPYKRDANWVRVVDINGRMGYVPVNFVEPDEFCRDRDLILTFLVDAVVKARQNNLPSVVYLESLRDEIREYPTMIEVRAREMYKSISIAMEQQIHAAGRQAKKSSSDQHLQKYSLGLGMDQHQATCKHQLQRVGSHHDVMSSCTSSTRNMPVGISSARPSKIQEGGDNDSGLSLKTAKEESAYFTVQPSLRAIKSKLVNVVQETSGLDPRLSENLLIEVFQSIRESTNHNKVPVEKILDRIASSPSMTDPDCPLSKLEKVMKTLVKMSRKVVKDRGQRRVSLNSEAELSGKLNELRKYLSECDAFQAAQLLKVEQCSFAKDLVHLYHLENPHSVKERMLEIFHIICTIDKPECGLLLTTSLPLFIARELMAGNFVNASGNLKSYDQLVSLLITLLATAEPMPFSHFEVMGTGFIHFLLKEIEDNATTNAEYHKKAYALIRIILAFNLQFIQGSSENIVLKVLAESRRRPRGFLVMLMDLFRTGCDPLEPEFKQNVTSTMMSKVVATNSVFRMITDICLCQRTIDYLTAADMEMLLNVIIEGLVKKPAGARMGYIHTLRALLGNWDRSLRDVRAALLSILLDTDPLAYREQEAIRAISKEFPMIFMQTISRIKMSTEVDNCVQQETDQEFYYLSS